MDTRSDAGSAIVIEVESSPADSSWANKYVTNTRRQRTTRRKRKPMTTPQPGHISRRCNNCGVTKTPQWREGPDGPKTLCNACGVKYSRERQDKSKSRKSRKLKPKTGVKSKLSISSVKKRTRNTDRDRHNYDFTFHFSTANPSSKMAKVSSSSIPGFTGKEYTAALSLVSLAVLGSPPPDARPRRFVYEEEDEVSDLATQPKTRRSKRIARRSHYYGGLDTEEWIPHLLEEMEEVRRHPGREVAMGVPCVWAAMGYSEYGDPCCTCKKQRSLKKATDSDRVSSASDSAKSDFLTT